MLQLQFTKIFSSYLSFVLLRSLVIFIAIIASITGILSPAIHYNNSPAVKGAYISSKKVSHTHTVHPYNEYLSQVSVLAIGESKKIIQAAPTPIQGSEEKKWGVAKQIDEHTWTMNVEKDTTMATAQEIVAALNAYRQKKGIASLSWDTTLASYAQSRADHFVDLANTDKHEGFTDYINNQDGFAKLGFNAVGENSSYGYQLTGIHLIEWVYAGDAPHDDNQLRSAWTHVGVGVAGVATDLIFAGSKR